MKFNDLDVVTPHPCKHGVLARVEQEFYEFNNGLYMERLPSYKSLWYDCPTPSECIAEGLASMREEDRMSRKDQDQDQPATPPATQTRTLAWTGYTLTVKELRNWFNQIPDQATITSMGMGDAGGDITASWEVTDERI